MPKRPTAKGFPCKPEDCYVSRHLDGPDYKIHDLMMATAKQNEKGERLFFASVRPYLVNASNQAASTVDATLERLEASGWIKNLARRNPDGSPILERKPDGKAKPHVYRVFDHADWAKDHPSSCPDYKLAPDYEEAQKYGVKRGEKLSTGALPTNFWPDDLHSALGKITSEEFSIVSDEESAALSKHTKEVAATLGGPVPAATPGRPEAAKQPLPVDRKPAASGGPESATSGGPEADGLRWTVQNPIQPILENPPHLSTLPQGEGGGRLGRQEATAEINALLAGVMRRNGGRPKSIGGKERAKLEELVMQDGREKFRAAAHAWLELGDWQASDWPFGSFVAGYAAFVIKHSNDAAKKKATEEDLKRTYEIAKQAHAEQWGLDLDKPSEPDAGDFLKEQ